MLFEDDWDETKLIKTLQTSNDFERLKILQAHEILDQIDTLSLLDFVVDQEKELRLRFLEKLHCTAILSNYDYVIFDCPPRLTASSIKCIGLLG